MLSNKVSIFNRSSRYREVELKELKASNLYCIIRSCHFSHAKHSLHLVRVFLNGCLLKLSSKLLKVSESQYGMKKKNQLLTRGTNYEEQRQDIKKRDTI